MNEWMCVREERRACVQCVFQSEAARLTSSRLWKACSISLTVAASHHRVSAGSRASLSSSASPLSICFNRADCRLASRSSFIASKVLRKASDAFGWSTLSGCTLKETLRYALRTADCE